MSNTFHAKPLYLLSYVVRTFGDRITIHALSVHNSVAEAFNQVLGTWPDATVDAGDYGCVVVQVKGQPEYQITRIVHYAGVGSYVTHAAAKVEMEKCHHVDEMFSKRIGRKHKRPAPAL